MKRLFFLLSMFACFIYLQAQPDIMPVTIDSAKVTTVQTDMTYTITPGSDIEQSIIDKVVSALYAFIDYVNWLYLIAFMLLTWIIGDFSRADNRAKWLNFIGKIPKLLFAFIIGIILVLVFYWGFDYHGKQDVMKMMFSILTALVIYKIGIDKVFAWLSKNLFKLNIEKPKATPPVNNTPQP